MNNKILIFIGSLNIGGTEKQLLKVLRAINKDYEIKIFAIQEKGILSKEFEKINIKILEPRFFRTKNNKIRKILFYSFLLYDVLKFFVIYKPKIVHYYLPHSYLLLGFLSLIFRKSEYIMSRRSLNKYQKKYLFSRKIETFFHRKMKYIIANSKAVFHELVNLEGVDKKKCHIIYNGVNLNFKKKKVDNGVKIVCLANLLPYKNHKMIILSLLKIPRKLKWSMHFIGSDKFGIKDSLKKIFENSHIKDRIFFHGQLKNPEKILASSDIGVLTSDEEGFSNSILEYMNHYLAVIATRVGGNEESIKEDITGFLINKNDSSKLSQKLTYLISNRAERERMGIEGNKRIKKEFSIQTCAQKYKKIYDDIIFSKN